MAQNLTDQYLLDDEPHILENPIVRIILFLIYSVVFFFCFFGNLAVVLVLTLHWRMRGVTKFCLGNLAFANLCVGIFCVYQNLFTYIMESWIFGNFLCKLYHFTNSLSHTASILILVVICVERYLVILHPFKCRRSLTMQRLRILMSFVWIVSAVLCSPRLYYINTIRVSVPGNGGNNGEETGTETEPGHKTDKQEQAYEEICVAQQNLYDSHTADIIYFVLLFALPLLVISILYTKIALFLQKNDIITTSMYPKGMVRGKRFYGVNPNLSESEATRSEPEQSLTERNSFSLRLKNSLSNLNINSCATSKSKSKTSKTRLMLSSAYLQMTAKFQNKTKKRLSIPSRDTSTSAISAFGVGLGASAETNQAIENYEMDLRQFSLASQSQGNKRESSICPHYSRAHLQLTFSNNFCDEEETRQKYENTSTCPTGINTAPGYSKTSFDGKKVHFQNRNRRFLKDNQNHNHNHKKEPKMQLKTLMKSKSYQRWKWQQNYDRNGRSTRNSGGKNNWRIMSNQSQQSSIVTERDRDLESTLSLANVHQNSFDTINDSMYPENKSILSKASSLIYCCCECAFPSHCNNNHNNHSRVPNPNNNCNSTEFINQFNNIQDNSICPIPITVESSSKGCSGCAPGTSASSAGTVTGSGTGSISGSGSSQIRYGRKLNRIRTFHPRPRQAVVRMLIIIVATFAVCNLPFHLRKLCQSHLPDYYFESDISDLMTPVTFILMYANCAINPILYAFIFKSFRSSFKDLVTCRWRRTRYLK